MNSLPRHSRTTELERIRAWLLDQADLATAIAFGSVASGKAGFDSDLDLAVAGRQPGRPLSTARRAQLLEQLAQVCGRPIDLVDLAEVGTPLLGEIVNGVRLLGSNADFGALLARHLIDEADFAPLRQRIIDRRRTSGRMNAAATVVAEKIESIRRCLERIRARCPETAGQLADNLDAQDIVSVNLTRAVQLAVDIAAHLIAESELQAPATMGESFDRLAEAGVIQPDLARRLKSAVGFRNLSVHSYPKIDWHIVHAIAQRAGTDFKEFARDVMKVVSR